MPIFVTDFVLFSGVVVLPSNRNLL
jgi:hypothetical protein